MGPELNGASTAELVETTEVADNRVGTSKPQKPQRLSCIPTVMQTRKRGIGKVPLLTFYMEKWAGEETALSLPCLSAKLGTWVWSTESVNDGEPWLSIWWALESPWNQVHGYVCDVLSRLGWDGKTTTNVGSELNWMQKWSNLNTSIHCFVLPDYGHNLPSCLLFPLPCCSLCQWTVSPGTVNRIQSSFQK